MAKIIVAGDAVVIKSDAPLEDIMLIEKYMPQSLTLTETDYETGKTSPIFKLGTTDGAPNISKFGVAFPKKADSEGKAYITCLIPEEVEDAKQYVSDTFGKSILAISTLEATFPNLLEQVRGQQDAIMRNITFA